MQKTTPADALRANTPLLSPKLLQEIIDSPMAAAGWCRVNAIVQFQQLINSAADPNFSPALRLRLAETLAKYGGVLAKEDTKALDEARPFVNIVFANDEPFVIEAQENV